jgi:ketosteroid isomerase-like protein
MAGEAFEAFKRAYLRGAEAMRRGDLEAAWAGVPEDFELHPPSEFPDPGVRRGPKEIVALLRELREEIPDWGAKPEEFSDAGGGTYIVRLEVGGISRAASIPAAASVYQVWESRDGVPVRVREFFDRDDALRSAGIDG